MTTLILIPARGGSKRLPGKNLRTVGGVSLVRRAIEVGQLFGSTLKRSMVVVDTDDPAIAFESMRAAASVPFLREREYAQDDTSSADSTIRFLDRLSAHGMGAHNLDTIVLLQPTSPLRTVEDVKSVYTCRRGDEWDAAFTVDCETREANGAVYMIAAPLLRMTKAFTPPGALLVDTMPSERSIDINTAEDLAEAERLWKVQHG